MAKPSINVSIPVRISVEERKDLEKEAEKQGRSLSNYIKWLLATHQDRQKKKSH
jgi:hypothetical protein